MSRHPIRVERLLHIARNPVTGVWEALCRYCEQPHDMTPITGTTWAACAHEVEHHLDRYHPTIARHPAPIGAAA